MDTYPVYYTYLVGWSKHNLWYYGRRTSSICHPSDLWKTYFTSSKEVKRLRLVLGEPDVVQPRKTFTLKEECVRWEVTVIRRMKASKSPVWLNKSHGQAGIGHKPRGCKEKQSTRDKKRLYQTGRVTIVNNQTGDRMRVLVEEARVLVRSGSHRYQRSGIKGKPQSEDQKKRHSEVMKGHTAWNKGVSKPRCCCVVCGVEIDETNLNRWHQH